jgi:NAD(P)-dependent dehydrogenase (short-subunit alcohol dehydrogenase family)
MGRDSDVRDVPLDVWRHTLDVTLTGYMHGIRHALPIMIAQGRGSIVNTMSSIVWMGEERRVAYQAAKAGLYGLTRHTAIIGGRHGVRCNSLAPRIVLTDSLLRETTEEFRAQMLGSVRSPRLGKPEDIASVVAFLFSDDSAYLNGQTLLVDGGANFT